MPNYHRFGWVHVRVLRFAVHGIEEHHHVELLRGPIQAAERVPEEQLYTAEAWEMILREILTGLKPFLDVEVDVLIEETLFAKRPAR